MVPEAQTLLGLCTGVLGRLGQDIRMLVGSHETSGHERDGLAWGLVALFLREDDRPML
jgi:hypothetical protein